MKGCTLCPRKCGAARTSLDPGYCKGGAQIRVARAAPHAWEEPAICGHGGSGTVFFSGCSLRCVYCQNREISRGQVGVSVSVERLADIFLALSQQGVCNINLVTAGHYVYGVARALELAKGRGLALPIVYNSGGYESVESLHRLDGLIDVYLPDYKYSSERLALKYSDAADYPSVAMDAIGEMVRQTGACQWQGEMLQRGTLVRLLLLPTLLIDAKRSLRRLFNAYGNRIAYSLMQQYTPMPGVEERFAELGRRVTVQEYQSFVGYAMELGIQKGFTQQREAASESFIPPFDLTGV